MFLDFSIDEQRREEVFRTEILDEFNLILLDRESHETHQ